MVPRAMPWAVAISALQADESASNKQKYYFLLLMQLSHAVHAPFSVCGRDHDHHRDHGRDHHHGRDHDRALL